MKMKYKRYFDTLNKNDNNNNNNGNINKKL